MFLREKKEDEPMEPGGKEGIPRPPYIHTDFGWTFPMKMLPNAWNTFLCYFTILETYSDKEKLKNKSREKVVTRMNCFCFVALHTPYNFRYI